MPIQVIIDYGHILLTLQRYLSEFSSQLVVVEPLRVP